MWIGLTVFVMGIIIAVLAYYIMILRYELGCKIEELDRAPNDVKFWIESALKWQEHYYAMETSYREASREVHRLQQVVSQQQSKRNRV